MPFISLFVVFKGIGLQSYSQSLKECRHKIWAGILPGHFSAIMSNDKALKCREEWLQVAFYPKLENPHHFLVILFLAIWQMRKVTSTRQITTKLTRNLKNSLRNKMTSSKIPKNSFFSFHTNVRSSYFRVPIASHDLAEPIVCYFVFTCSVFVLLWPLSIFCLLWPKFSLFLLWDIFFAGRFNRGSSHFLLPLYWLVLKLHIHKKLKSTRFIAFWMIKL